MRAVLTPLVWMEWDWLIELHPDQQLQSYIVDGIQNGFRVGFNYECELKKADHNMPSTFAHPDLIRDYLATECSKGRVLGPLEPTCFPQVQISWFGVIPKGSTGKWQLIIDLSLPRNYSVNDGVSENLSSLAYASIWDAVQWVTVKGAGALVAKVDIKHAYRNIPMMVF